VSGRQEDGSVSGARNRSGRTREETGERKCVEGVLLVIGANLILPFARCSPY